MVNNAREYFPRGLIQPSGSYRFASDSLLLASFPHLDSGRRFLDLGTGCGVVALGLLCRALGNGISMTGYGVDMQAELVAAANMNARRLGFSDMFEAVAMELHSRDASLSSLGASKREFPLFAASYDYVLANPPYRQRHKGRLPANPSRCQALFEVPSTLSAFCSAAAHALSSEGRFVIVYPALRKEELLTTLADAGLVPARLLPVHPHGDALPSLILLEARSLTLSSDLTEMICEPPLVLHEGQGKSTRFTQKALAFCPFLSCNAHDGNNS